MAKPTTWVVSVDTVSALAPHIAITEARPATPGEKPFDLFNKDAIRKITVPEVEKFIQDVSSMVELRLYKRARVRSKSFRDALDTAAMDIIANGAGSYLVAAAFPSKAGINDNTAYSAELWRRYKDALEELAALLDAFIARGGPDVEPDATDSGRVFSNFPLPMFPDDMRF